MKNYLSMKTLTDFRKTAETGVDPRLVLFIPRLQGDWFRF